MGEMIAGGLIALLGVILGAAITTAASKKVEE